MNGGATDFYGLMMVVLACSLIIEVERGKWPVGPMEAKVLGVELGRSQGWK